MKRKILAIVLTLALASVSYAAIAGYNTTFPNMNVTATPSDVTPTVTPANGTCYVEGTLEVDGATRLDAALDLNSTADISGTLAVGGVTTFTAAPISSAGKYGVTTADGVTNYAVPISTSLTDALDYTVLASSGKAGGFLVIAGTYCAIGSFTSAAAVTLASNSSVDTGTSNGTDEKVNVYDNGATIAVENQTGGTKVFFIWIWYIN